MKNFFSILASVLLVLPALSVSAQEEETLARVSERFLLEQTGVRIPALDFYKSIR